MIKSGGRIEGIDKAKSKMNLILTEAGKTAKEVIGISSILLASHLKEESFTGGTTATRLRVRTGKLRASVRAIETEIKPKSIEGGVSIGTVYGRVHVGPKGQKTVIKPKSAKYLTIPLLAAQTRAGVTRGPARSEIWGDTFVAKSKAGNLIIFGKSRIMKGKRLGELKGKIKPLFLLLKSVTIPARVHPEEALKWLRPKLIEGFRMWGIQIKEK